MTMQAKLTTLGEWPGTGAALAGGDFSNNLVATNTPWGQPVTIASGTVTWPSHGMSAGQLVYFTFPSTATATAVTSNTLYIVAGTITTNAFQISAVFGGSVLATAAVTPGAGAMVQGYQMGSTPNVYTAASSLGGLVLNNDISIVSTIATTVTAGTSVTVTSAAPGVVTWTSHSFSAGQPVYFTASAMPTGLTANTIYYVSGGSNLTANTFALSTTLANALAASPVSITTSSTGTTVVGYASNGIDTATTNGSLPLANCAILPSQGSAFLTVFNSSTTANQTLWVFPPIGGYIYGSNPSITRTAVQNTAWNTSSAFPISINKSTTFQCPDPATSGGNYTYVAQHAG